MKNTLIKLFEAIISALGGGKTIDGEINAESENPVQNKAIYTFVKAEINEAFFVDERSEAV